MATQQVYEQVRDHYSAASKATAAEYGHSVAKAFGYSEDELATIPKDSNLGLSCGNPLAITSIREGETVVDLGSGAGFDVFLAANKVGSTGKAIGVDFNKDMLARANKIKQDTGRTNVEFIESPITSINLPSSTADCIISNCVVNLVPEEEKQLAFNEMFRLLRPGGRIALSDILARKPLSEKIRQSVALYVGCIAGAGTVAEYEGYLQKAGFSDVLITDTNSDLNVYLETNADGSKTTDGSGAGGSCCGGPQPAVKKGCCSSSAKDDQACAPEKAVLGELKDTDLNEWAGSFKIYAVKA